jgi:death on curing protein
MIEPEWVALDIILAIHEEQLAEHGGLLGIRDQGMLESALARPQNLFAYSPGASLHQLAAAYAVGIGKNHGFVDGNKRTAWVVCAVFLELNGMRVFADQADVVRVMLQIATDSITEANVVSWLNQVTTEIIE